jgi:hypothetical protein
MKLALCLAVAWVLAQVIVLLAFRFRSHLNNKIR